MWCKTTAFSSNMITTDPAVILLGTLVTGILTPTFGTHLTAQMEAWTTTTGDEWQMTGLGGTPHPRNFDLDPATADMLPVLGGSAFDLVRLRYAISGVRLRPPPLDPHVFHRELASSSNAPQKEGERKVDVDPRGVDDCGYRKTAKQLYAQVQFKEKRDESVLAKARRTHSRRTKSEGRNRGRPTSRKGRRNPEYTDIGRQNMNGP